jgi:DNA-binding NarL/FixJ family response regulator
MCTKTDAMASTMEPMGIHADVGGMDGADGHAGSRLRLLVVDDHDLFRTGLRALLVEAGFEVRDAAGGRAAIELTRMYRPDVVIMDMQMPGMSGIEATRRVLEVQPEAVVLMLTVAADEESVLEAIRAGASGYLLKEARLPEIVAAVNAVAEGRSPIAPGVAGALFDSIRHGPVTPRGHAGVASLTDRERAVLALLAEGYDNGEIAARLYVSQSTVKNHVSRLLEKLGVDNRVRAAAFAVRHGLDRSPSAR